MYCQYGNSEKKLKTMKEKFAKTTTADSYREFMNKN